MPVSILSMKFLKRRSLNLKIKIEEIPERRKVKDNQRIEFRTIKEIELQIYLKIIEIIEVKE